MAPAKSKTTVGLGNSLMNDRFGRGKGQDMRRGAKGIQRTGADGTTYITTEKQEPSWMKMRSVTEQPALDEFLSNAALAGTDFTAEKLNSVKIIHTSQKNPHLLSAAEERSTVKKQNANKKRLKVPRRPLWDEQMGRSELDERERESLMEWRRGLADLQENHDLLMTPFERNLEVWRQLWRVIERSDLVVQIVDARNPLLFRCEDLENYVKEVDAKKENLLLVNKADMMTLHQRQAWARYFEQKGINFRFFSAHLAKDENQVEDDSEVGSSEDESDSEAEEGGVEITDETVLARAAEAIDLQQEKEEQDQWVTEETIDDTTTDAHTKDTDSTRIITTQELEALFLENAPGGERPSQPQGSHATDPHTSENTISPARKTTVGLVGYPNVGKSSTINALLPQKKVSVSATPGKTKHFQTLHLSDRIILCDCPGLVFPNFASTKAELVVNGVLPIDQLREHTGPAALVAQRIPQAYLERVYGMKITTQPLEEGGTGVPTAEELLAAYARARGFWTTGKGVPDEPRAARHVLKDYVRGKLLFCQPPPLDPAPDRRTFNRELYNLAHLARKQRTDVAMQDEAAIQNNPVDPSLMDDPDSVAPTPAQGEKSTNLDKRFFKPAGRGSASHVTQGPQARVSEAGLASGKQLSGRKLKSMVALENGVEVGEVKMGGKDSKKHFKGGRRGKGRGEYT